ncbi:hypothetical protein IW147_005269 [Coemansia sp. RSA 720]|nr:hypothetical protein IW147_005269 [Coemansia sp. RSA 720]
MAKRSGELTVEWDSPERKRLRNEESTLYSFTTPHVSPENACANAIVALLQENHAAPLLRAMDVAVQLVQKLKVLQLLGSPQAHDLFDQAYGRVLDFVGDVVYNLQLADRADRSSDKDDLEPMLNSFASVYQYLVEIIARHTECPTGSQPHSITDQEMLLVALPLVVRMTCESKELAAYDVPLFSHIDTCGPILRALSRSSVRASLIALVLMPSSYSTAYLPWIVRAYSWCLAKDALLRPSAWVLFPAFCFQMCQQGRDGYTEVTDKPRITVDDPPDLVEVVASVVGFVACARAGGLQVRPQKALPLPEWTDDEPSLDTVQQSVFGVLNSALSNPCFDILALCSVYSCAMCDSHCSKQPNPGQNMGESSRMVSLSDWLPYWFIASSRQHETTSVRFVRSAVRFIGHAPPEDMALKSSPLGQGIIRRLSSSNRDIRLAARDAVLSYSQRRLWDSNAVAQIKQANRAETMQILCKLMQELHGPSIVEEVFLLVAGGIGRVSQMDDNAMCEVLPYMVRYYCSSNVFLRAVAMEQLLAVSQVHQVPVARLLSCFSEHISCELAGTLNPGLLPAPFVQCMQMLATAPSDFLNRFQARIVPELFIGGNETALKAVASILDIRLPVLCVNQAASIFARMFLMDDQPMQKAMLRFVSLLSAESELDKEQVEVNIPSLLRSCSVKLIFNLVLALGEHDSILRKRARSAIATVQNILDGANTQGVAVIVQQNTSNMRTMASNESPRSGGPTKPHMAASSQRLASFVSQHILGVLAYMNELLRDTAETAMLQNEHIRRKAVMAIGEMVALLGAQAATHANNVVASLTPVLSGPIADCALDVWIILADNLQHARLSADQVNSLLVPLVAAFVAADSNRSLVAKAVDRVVMLHKNSIKQHYAEICPVPEHPLLAASYTTMQGFSRKAGLRQRLDALAKLLAATDSTVVLCAAREMGALVQQNSTQITAWKAAFRPGEIHQSGAGHRGEAQADAAFISKLLSALWQASSVGGPLGEVAAAACAACIGFIGVVDIQVLDKTSGQHQEPHNETLLQPELRDLNGDEDERVEFVCTLLTDYLSRAFAMAPSPSVQMFTAHSIQELLRLAGFTKELLIPGAEPDAEAKSGKRKKADGKKARDKGAQARATWLRQRWEMLPESVVGTVWPLLDSKYTIQFSTNTASSGSSRTACVTSSASYVGWLRAWIVELTNSLTAPGARDLFRACLGAVKEGSAELLRFVLPQVVYQYVLQRQGKGDDSALIVVDDDEDSACADAVVDELLAVLADDAAEPRMGADQLRLCRVAALELLDACDSHVRTQQHQRTVGKRSSRRDTRATQAEKAVQRVASSVPYNIIARASASCGQYERAVQSTELWQRERSGFGAHATEFGHVDDAVLEQLQELYFKLDDEDGMAGAEQSRSQEDRAQTLRRYEIEGNWAYALIGHEAQLRMEPQNADVQRRWIECLQSMGQWEGAWTAARSLAGDVSGLQGACYAAAWRLGKWDWVEQAGAVDTGMSFDAASSALLLGVERSGLSGLGHLAQPVILDQSMALDQGLDRLTREMDVALRIAGREIKMAGTTHRIAANVHAHMLGDLALAAAQFSATEHDCAAVSVLAEKWRVRVASLPTTYAVQEPVLALHASVYAAIGTGCEGCAGTARRAAARTRLQAAQLARLGGSRATTLSMLAFAEAEADADTGADVRAWLQIERAQVMWHEGFAAAAMTAMRRVSDGLGVQVRVSGESDAESEAGSAMAGDATRAAFAHATLLLTQWQEASNAVGSTQLLAQYERALRVHESDRAHYALARLYDTLFVTLSEKDARSRETTAAADHRSLQMATLQYYVVRHYGRTLMHGARYLFRALPRLLTVWLDFGANILRPADARSTRMVDRFRTANRVVANLARRLPAYNFLVVMAQLVSRICHPNEDVFAVIESILLNVLALYPQQAMWQLVGVQRSTYAARAARCNAVLAKARAAGAGDLVQQASKLTDLLLALCNAVPARGVTAMHMATDFRALARAAPLDVVVPLQRCLTPAVPDAGNGDGELALGPTPVPASQQALHQPFSSDLPTIAGFDDAIDVMHSLQRPKKITVVGSDGHRYSFLCKPKDDLRKDARLMEFNAMINQLFGGDARARPRRLRICTYAVVPLNEECGLIEWVPNTVGVRHVLLRLYSAHGVSVSMAQAKALLDAPGAEPERQFLDHVLPRFPSVLHEWFVRQFGSPCAWLAARTSFTRSAAVMSMVGHILGLGDRHCENILLDERSGGVLHVDFNCLFDKGLSLEKPERVPFRLTHNMVDAMGVTGYEGAFRRSCELALGLLREHRDALMSVLESFLHDPLVEWSRRTTRASSRSKETADGQPNEHASRSLSAIRRKLQGSLQGMAPLSVEGQVDELIQQATDPKRLCQMYVGWAPFM